MFSEQFATHDGPHLLNWFHNDVLVHDSYPEDSALARFLGDTGGVARECFAAIPGWFPA